MKMRVRGSLTSEYGELLVDMVNSNRIPILCDTIMQKHPECTLLLLEHAKRHGNFSIMLGAHTMLEWAVINKAEEVARFLLDCVAEKRLPVDESSCILTDYLFPLITDFPNLARRYIKNDRFSFEYGRFSVSRSLIEKNKNRPIAMITEEPPDEFTMEDSKTVRDFWIEKCEEHSEDLKEESADFQVEMAAKFFCVEDPAVLTKDDPTREQLCVCLDRQDFPADFFESDALRNLVDWWFYYHHHIYYSFIMVDGIATLFFTIFAYLYGHQDKLGKWHHQPLLLGLSLSSIVLRYGSFFFYWSYPRQEIVRS